MRRDHFVTALSLAAAALFTGAVWYLYYKQYFTGLVLNDAMDYAGIARNVARGQGFISQYVTPLSLAHHGVPQPDMWRAPLWPLALAGFQKMLGFIDEASAIGSGFFFAATGPVVFLLARQWFGSLVAAGSVLIYSLTPKLLYFSISGMTEPLAVFLTALAVLAASSRGLRNKPGDWLSGAALGLFYLARYNALVFLPFFLGYRWLSRREGSGPPLRMLAGFTLAALPWLARNCIIFGNPFFSLQKYEPVMFTRIYPDYSLYLHPRTVDVAAFVKNETGALMEKIAANWGHYLESFLSPDLNGVPASIFIIFLASLALPLGGRSAGIRPLIVFCYLAQLAALLVIHFIPRLFLVFAPFYIIFALGALSMSVHCLAGKLGLKSVPGLLTAIFAIFLAFCNLTGSTPPEKEIPDRDRYLKIINDLAGMVPPDRVILTNEGHLVSWYGDRYACKIPYSVDMVPDIKKRAGVGALFISDRILWHMPEADRSWKFLWYQHPGELHSLRLTKTIPDRGVIYLAPR
ncbi:MAG: glycosyltransferase family 39 protein [Peptococcaceae bacterium]|nr:glycosyltransferase family 39 protein [Peptococcaceae bacterium]